MLLWVACAGLLIWRFVGIWEAYSDSWAPMNLALQKARDVDAGGIYATVFFSMGVKFQYPPSALFYLEALDALGLNTERRLNGINWILLVANAVALGALTVRLVASGAGAKLRRTCFLLGVLCAMAYGPVSAGFNAGQIQLLINLLFTLATFAICAEHSRLGGALLGLSAAIKPTFGILLAQAAIQRHWRLALGFLASATALAALSVVHYGWHEHLDYLRVLRHLTERGESYAWNNSVNGIMNRLLNNGSAVEVVVVHGIGQSPLPPFHPLVYWATQGTTALLLLLALALPLIGARAAGEQAGRWLLFSIGGVCAVIASPIAWIHHYAILLPLYLVALRVLLDYDGGRGRPLRLSLVALSFALTAVRYPFFPEAKGLETLVHAPTFFGATILLGVLVQQFLARERTLRLA